MAKMSRFPSVRLRGRYLSQNDSLVYQKTTDGTGVGLFAKQTIRADTVICSASGGGLMALDTARLQDSCYFCFAKEHDPADLRSWKTSACEQLRECDGCGMVKFCSIVRSIMIYDLFCRTITDQASIAGLREESLSPLPRP